MRSKVFDILPRALKKSFLQLGHNLSLARRKRGITQSMMAERLGVSKSTYLRVESGDPKVAMGVYAMTFFVLGMRDPLVDQSDSSRDEQGLLFDEEIVAKRVRTKKEPTGR
jgi:DNA-binding XRE family transcriptional regulator